MSRDTTRPDHAGGGPAGDYLWDGGGTPDPLVASLETTLAPLAHRGRMPAAIGRPPRRRRVAGWATAAAVLLAAGAWYVAVRPAPAPPRGPVSWQLDFDAINGVVKVVPPDTTPQGESGQWIETGEAGSATLRAKAGALLTLMAGSRARVVDLGNAAQRLTLERGALYTSPSGSTLPTEIDTPAGRLVIRPDTACLVRLNGAEAGRIEVKTGRVECTTGGRLTRVPGGCVAAMWNRGVGTPRRTGATGLEGLLSKFDDSISRGVPVAERAELLRATLKSCGWDDQVTLWNLMWRVAPEERKLVVGAARDRTKTWVKSPSDALMRLEPGAMEEWWRLAVGE